METNKVFNGEDTESDEVHPKKKEKKGGILKFTTRKQVAEEVDTITRYTRLI